MVNINLNRDDDYSREQNYTDDSFSQTLNLDSKEFADERDDFRSEMPEFPSSSNSNTRVYAVLGVLLVVVLVIIAMLWSSGGDDSDIPPDLRGSEDVISDSPVDINEAGESQMDDPGAMMDDDLSSGFDLESLPPIEQKIKLSAALGAVAVQGVNDAMSSDVGLSLVRFVDSSFLAEIKAGSSAGLDNAVEMIRQNTQASNFRVVSRENENIAGSTIIKAIISGDLDQNTAPVVIRGGVSPVALSDLTSWLKSTAGSNQLRVERLNVSNRSSNVDGYQSTPVELNLRGSVSDALGFLTAVEDASPNVLIDKISVINNDVSVSTGSTVNLVVVMKHINM